EAYRRLMEPFLRAHDRLLPGLLAPLRWPAHPFLLLRFGLRGLRSASGLANALFREPRARALFAGCAAHSILPFDRASSAAIGLVLLLTGHAHGWPFPRGGSEAIARALAAYFVRLGGGDRNGSRHPIALRSPARLRDAVRRHAAAASGDLRRSL